MKRVFVFGDDWLSSSLWMSWQKGVIPVPPEI